MDQKRAFISRKIEDLQFLHDTTTVVEVDFGNTKSPPHPARKSNSPICNQAVPRHYFQIISN